MPLQIPCSRRSGKASAPEWRSTLVHPVRQLGRGSCYKTALTSAHNVRLTRDMPRKNMNKIQKLYLAHRRASVSCDVWAEKAIRYRQAGDLRKAQQAEDRTFRCLTRMKRLADRWQLQGLLGPPATLH